MKKISKQLLWVATSLVLALLAFSTNAQTVTDMSENKNDIFPMGQPGPAEKFTGRVWVHSLVDDDSVYQLVSGSVTFEPGARSNWHRHPGGQILMVIKGTGYHQIKGKPRQVIRKGDVVKCPRMCPTGTVQVPTVA